MKKMVISAIGKDRPGIVAGVTQVLFDAGCNLEDSAMTILEGEFAVLLIATKPRKMSFALFESCLQRQAKKLGLVLGIKEMEVARGKRAKLARMATISASGRDQTGILYRLSRVLAAHGANITDLTSRQIPGPCKTTLYAVMIEISLPTKLSLPVLRDALEKIARPMHLDVIVRKIGVEKL